MVSEGQCFKTFNHQCIHILNTVKLAAAGGSPCDLANGRIPDIRTMRVKGPQAGTTRADTST